MEIPLALRPELSKETNSSGSQKHVLKISRDLELFFSPPSLLRFFFCMCVCVHCVISSFPDKWPKRGYHV